MDLILGDMIMSQRTDDGIAKDSLPFLCQFMGFHEKKVQQKWVAGPNEVEALWDIYLKIAHRQESHE